MSTDDLERHHSVCSARASQQQQQQPNNSKQKQQSSKCRLVFDCPFCDRKFDYQQQLEMHLVHGWCPKMPSMYSNNPAAANGGGISDANFKQEVAKLYKVWRWCLF